MGFAKRAALVALGGGGYPSFAMGRHLGASLHNDVLLPLYRPESVFQDLSGVVFQTPVAGKRALGASGGAFDDE